MVGVKAGPVLAGALYLLLVASAGLALGARQFPGVVPRGLEVAAPWLFFAFLLGFGAYRVVLVRRGKYRAFKAFFQIGVAALFFVLLLPFSSGVRWPGATGTAPPEGSLVRLLASGDAAVRAAAAELARHRPEAAEYVPSLVRALSDSDERVRIEAHRSLVVITGVDLGPPSDAEAVRAWHERFP